MAIEKSEVKDIVKEAIQATGSVQYPDLLLFVAQRLLREPLDQVLDGLEKKDLIERSDDPMGTVIIKKRKGKK